MLRSHIIICSVVTIMHVPDALTFNSKTTTVVCCSGGTSPDMIDHLGYRNNRSVVCTYVHTLLRCIDFYFLVQRIVFPLVLEQ